MMKKMIRNLRSPVAGKVLRTSLKDNDKKMIRKLRNPVAEKVPWTSLKDKDKEIIRKRPAVKYLL